MPPAITLLAAHDNMGPAMAMLICTAVGTISLCLALLAGPETKGTDFVPELVVAWGPGRAPG